MNLPSSRGWVGGYVEYEWTHLREILCGYDISVDGCHVLEFGCNYGASAIVLSCLGAHVTAVDVDSNAVKLARANAGQYGADDILFSVVEAEAALPLRAGQFDLIICNSVLEYVDAGLLRGTLLELDRVLRLKGALLITGTSSRLWPREIHIGSWLANYRPRLLDRLTRRVPIRGVSPFKIRAVLKDHYRDGDVDDGGEAWLQARASVRGRSRPPRAALMLAAAARLFNTSPGWLTPHISARMIKVA